VECFCFEEQKLLAGEEVDMPLLFFIDKDVLDDPSCRNIDNVVLSYTFFRYVPSFEIAQLLANRLVVQSEKKCQWNAGA
jgi:cytochrome c oxidase assembly protein Cox11